MIAKVIGPRGGLLSLVAAEACLQNSHTGSQWLSHARPIAEYKNRGTPIWLVS